MGRIREEHQDVIVDVAFAIYYNREFSVQETLLIPQSKEWLENARDLLQNNFFNHKQSLTLITKYLL
jgi:hypothetical protein